MTRCHFSTSALWPGIESLAEVSTASWLEACPSRSPTGGLDLWDLLTLRSRAAPPVPGRGGRAKIGPGTRLAAPAFSSTTLVCASAKLQLPRSRCTRDVPNSARTAWGQDCPSTWVRPQRVRRSSPSGRAHMSLASQLRGSPPCTFLGQIGLCWGLASTQPRGV